MRRALQASSRTGLRRRVMAVVAAASMVTGSLSLAAGPATAAPNDVMIPLATTYAAPEVIAAGAHNLLKATDLDTQETFIASLDGGLTWANANIPGFGPGSTDYATDGHIYFQDLVGDGFVVKRYDFATNSTSQVAQLDAKAVSINATHAVTGKGDDGNGNPTSYVSTELATGVTHTLASASHHGSMGSEPRLGSGAFALVVNATYGGPVGGTGYIDLLPLVGGKRLSAKVAGLSDASLRGDQVVYLTETKTRTAVCFRSATSWSHSSCKTVRKGTYSAPGASLDVGPGWVTVMRTFYASNAEAFVVNGTSRPTSIAKLKPPAGATVEFAYAAGAADRPIVRLVTSTGGYVASYRADGAFTHLVDYLPTTAGIRQLHLTPAAVVAADDRPTISTLGEQVWSRSVTDGVAGKEQLLAPRASGFTGLNASDRRTIIRGLSGVALLDGGKFVRKLPSNSKITTLSGAYYLTGGPGSGEMRRIDGTRVLRGPVIDIFGSLALKSLSHGRYEVVDASGRTAVVKGSLPKAVNNGLTGAKLWGDWVMASGTDSFGGDTAVVFNYRDPTRVHVLDGTPQALGDGFVLVDSFGLLSWNFETGATEALVDGSTNWDRAVTDGSHHAAWVTDTGIEVHQLSGVGATQPLVLGVVAPRSLNNLPTTASWRLEIDATKALAAGALVIKNSAGAVVRTIPVTATKDGSIRGVSWNGRADDGVTPVPVGTYTWELTAPSADGSGNLVINTLPANAGRPVMGTLKVSSRFLGTVSGPTPKLSDTTPTVGQTLTVATRTWKPVGTTTLSYQWFRGTVAVGGNAPTYQVTAADRGQKLTVTVTGVADGWRTTHRTTSATAKVVDAP